MFNVPKRMYFQRWGIHKPPRSGNTVFPIISAQRGVDR